MAQPTRCGKAAGQLRQRFRSTFLPATQLKYDRFLRTKVYGVCGQLASLPCSTLTLEISGLPWRQGVGQVSNGDSQRGRHGHVRLPFVRRGWRYAAKHHSSRTGIPACKVRRLRHRRCNQATVADGRIFRRTNHGKSADTTAGCWHPRGARPFDRRREQPAERSLRTVP